MIQYNNRNIGGRTMCGRYQSWIEDEELVKIVEREKKGSSQLYFRKEEITPGMTTPVLYGGSICVRAGTAVWGYPVEKEGRTKLIFNARAESAASKSLFRDDIAGGRIVVPASGYYEWKDGRKYRIGRGILYLAGLFRQMDKGYRFVILTTEPTPEIRPIHDRMPLLLSHDEIEKWLYDESFSRRKLLTPNTVSLSAEAV